MKKYSKEINCDERGQIVIPKDMRIDLGVEDGTGFYMYVIPGEGILLKKIDILPLDQNEEIINELKEKSDKLNLKKENLSKSLNIYKKTNEGNLEVI